MDKFENLTTEELITELKIRNLNSEGTKDQLIQRLKQTLEKKTENKEDDDIEIEVKYNEEDLKITKTINISNGTSSITTNGNHDLTEEEKKDARQKRFNQNLKTEDKKLQRQKRFGNTLETQARLGMPIKSTSKIDPSEIKKKRIERFGGISKNKIINSAEAKQKRVERFGLDNIGAKQKRIARFGLDKSNLSTEDKINQRVERFKKQ
eukprot:TRINITY_DN5337_c0_g2_i1.p1 TRINITY_DN5337_c0_g2~~TRINITY_DN5337_c0_g2_i1.p1  ORF type:complete len:220 (+),score=107.56 TRINITY_DN5337_c0_g2_i1:39-662(+)